MKKINLLPLEYKKTLYININFQKVINILIAFLFFLIVLFISLKFINRFFGSEILELENFSENNFNNSIEISQELKYLENLNLDLNKINEDLENENYILDVFKIISTNLPSKIYLTNFKYNKLEKNYTINLFSEENKFSNKILENLNQTNFFTEINLIDLQIDNLGKEYFTIILK